MLISGEELKQVQQSGAIVEEVKLRVAAAALFYFEIHEEQIQKITIAEKGSGYF